MPYDVTTGESEMTNLKNVLQNPDKYFVVWLEPHYGMDKEGNKITCARKVSTTLKEAIAISRDAVVAIHGKHPEELSEEELLREFITIHWADIEERKENK